MSVLITIIALLGSTPQLVAPPPEPPEPPERPASAFVVVVSAPYGTGGPAPYTLHVHATDTDVPLPLEWCDIHWDFGDPAGTYDTLPGFNASHVYDTPGDYEARCTIAAPDGSIATATVAVEVRPSSRRVYHVSANGSSAAPGTEALPISLGHARSLTDHNTEFRLRRGDEFDTTDIWQISGHDVVIGAYGDGPRPLIRYSGRLRWSGIIDLSGDPQGVTIQDLAIRNLSADDSQRRRQRGVMADGRVTVRRVRFHDTREAIQGERGASGLHVEDCHLPEPNLQNLAWIDGEDITLIGCSAADVTGSHGIRTGRTARLLVYDCDLTVTAPKTAFWSQRGSHVWVERLRAHRAPIGIGPNGARGDASDRLDHATVRNSTTKGGGIVVSSGTHGFYAAGNVIEDGHVGFEIKGALPSRGRETTAVLLRANSVRGADVGFWFNPDFGAVRGGCWIVGNVVDRVPTPVSGNLQPSYVIVGNGWVER